MGIDQLQKDLSALGLERGDVVLVRASVRALGLSRDPATQLLEAVLNIVGDKGTVLGLSYTPSIRAPFKRPPDDMIFHSRAATYAGAFPQCMIDDPRSIRSLHPTSSVVAIGQAAARLLEGHDHTASAYLPIQRLIQERGKMILIGCVTSSPGFTTAHVAEQAIAMGWRYIWPKAHKCYYLTKDGSKAIFKRPDPGFCSQSFKKFYGMYVAHRILRAGYVGEAYSILTFAHLAYEIERSTLLRDPSFNICDDPMCALCNVYRWDRLHRAAIFLGKRSVQRVKRVAYRCLSRALSR